MAAQACLGAEAARHEKEVPELVSRGLHRLEFGHLGHVAARRALLEAHLHLAEERGGRHDAAVLAEHVEECARKLKLSPAQAC